MKILQDEKHKKFAEYAALLLSRSNEPKKVFGKYIKIVPFCKNWKRIKKRMRENKWSDKRIDFWDEIYKVAIANVADARKEAIKYARKVPINKDVHKIGQALVKQRKKRGWTQEEFSKKVGLSQQTISLIEIGNLNFSFKTFIKVAKALDIDIIVRPKAENTTSEGSTFTN